MDGPAGRPADAAEQVAVETAPASAVEVPADPAPQAPAGTTSDPPRPPDPPIDVATSDRSLERLAPELRARVERVMRRMRSEFGHEVHLVEGYRSPARQRFLYAQGRTRPGPVVTWTQHSLHSVGLAADLQVDGSWDRPAAYALLQRIAREEGLQTLGMKDPGHVALDPGGAFLREGAPGRDAAPARDRFLASGRSPARDGSPMRGGDVARDHADAPGRLRPPDFAATRVGVARVAAVSRVAHAAPVARIAGAARPGMSGPRRIASQAVPDAASQSPRGTLPSPPPALTLDMPLEVAASGSATVNRDPALGAPLQLGRSFDADGGRDHPATRLSQPEERATGATGATLAGPPVVEPANAGASTPVPAHPQGVAANPGAAPLAPPGPAPTTPTKGVDGIARVERILDMKDAAVSVAPARVSVRVDRGGGVPERIRVGLTGKTVDADIALARPEAAEHLKASVGELHRALASRGLDGGTVKVNAPQTTVDGGHEVALASRVAHTGDPLRSLLTGPGGGAEQHHTERERSGAHERFPREGSDRNPPRKDPQREEKR